MTRTACIAVNTMRHLLAVKTELSDVRTQVPGGQRVPFLFTIKELQASGDLAKFGGTFKVPSYRGSTFLDPKVASSPSLPVSNLPVSWGNCLFFCSKSRNFRVRTHFSEGCPWAGQGRGGSQGYDAALALQTKADVDELEKENIKSFAALEGEIAFSVVKVSSPPFPHRDHTAPQSARCTAIGPHLVSELGCGI